MSHAAPTIDPHAPVERDPTPGPTLYFMVLGFALLAASALGLAFLANAQLRNERGAKAPSAASNNSLNRAKKAQLDRLKQGGPDGKPIDEAMREVVRRYGERR